MCTIKKSVFVAKAALPKGENVLPRFRDPKHDSNVCVRKGVDEKYTKLMGLDCGRRVLPYTQLDKYDRDRKKTEIPSIVLENKKLRATFLPTLGARLISLFDKENDKELLYSNTGIQVANLGITDGWFAGGIEWNLGQYGHTFNSSSNVFASVQQDEKGEDFLRFYDYERCKGLWWHMDFHLPKNSSLLYAHVEVHNLYEEKTSMYYWTNSAVELTDSTRVFSADEHAIYLDPYAPEGSRRYGQMHLPEIEIYPGVDASYPKQFAFSNEYFFTCEESKMPWECAVGKDGEGFFEASTPLLAYRKMFCWGDHDGGKHWQRFLAPELGDREYVEIQSGLVASQLHGMFIEGKSSLSWTQAFGSIKVDPTKAHRNNFHVSNEYVSSEVYNKIDNELLAKLDKQFANDSKIAPKTILQKATGWGYLEKILRCISLPPALKFDRSDVTKNEKPWLSLLENDMLPIQNREDLPYHVVVNQKWINKLEADIAKNTDPEQIATLKHYLGIALLENEKEVEAMQCWYDVMNTYPNVWTARNLAVFEARRGTINFAKQWYEKALELSGFYTDIALPEEYFKFLVDNEFFDEAKEYFDSLPKEYLEKSEVIALTRAILAAHFNDAKTIKELILDKELAHIREGEAPINELWYKYNAIIYAQEHNVEITDSLIAKMKDEKKIPFELDYNMYS